MAATASTIDPSSARISDAQAKAVQKFMSDLNAQPGHRQGETSTPTANLVTFQVSSWLQVPQILKALETRGGDGIKLTFPTTSDPASVTKARELQNFFEKFHAKTFSEMLTELTTQIEASGELAQTRGKLGWFKDINSPAQWVAAFQPQRASLQDKLKVTNVVNVATSSTGAVDPSIFVQAKHAVTAGRQVVYQLDGTQGAASALFKQLSRTGAPDPKSYAIWSGSTEHYPKAVNPAPVENIASADFLAREAAKAPMLKELDDLTKPHRDVYFELAKIKTRDLEEKGSNGLTVLENLHRIANAPALIGVEPHIQPTPPAPGKITEWRAHLAAAAIERLYHPGRANQDQHGTCGAESIIRLTGTARVGEWARLVADLIVDGECRLSNGATLKPANDWLLNDESLSREAFDALLQSSLMRFAAGRLGFDYRNQDDSFVNAAGDIQYQLDSRGRKIPERDSRGRIVYEADGVTPKYEKSNGMLDLSAAELITGLLGQENSPVEKRELRRRFGADFVRRLATIAEQSGGMYVGLTWGSGGHAVVLTGYDAATDRLIFSNPHGENPGKSNGDVLPDPERYIVDNEYGIQSMDRKKFEKLLLSAILPK